VKKKPAKPIAKKTGRPSEFRSEMCAQVAKLARLGATDKEAAEFFGVSEQTLNSWKKKHPAFFESLKEGKAKADALVADRLFERATGYEHPEVHVSNYQGVITLTPLIKRYPPDPTACIFWLKNRRPELWRDKQTQEHVGKDDGPVSLEVRFVDSPDMRKPT